MRTRRAIATLLAMSLALAACAPSAGASPSLERLGLTAAAIEEAMKLEDVIRGYEATWGDHDLEAFSDYIAGEGFVFLDMGHRLDSKAAFIDFMKPFLTDPEHIGAIDNRFHLGEGELVESYRTWGFAESNEDDPLVEVDLFEVADGTITSIRSMYGLDLVKQYIGVDWTETADRYVAAWTSGDIAQIESLYTDATVREEPLFGERLEGGAAIAAQAIDLLDRHQAPPELVEPYVFADDRMIGAVFALTDDAGCRIEYTALAEPDAAGTITSERVFYDVGLIQECGWKR